MNHYMRNPLPPHILADALQDKCEHIGEGRLLRSTPINTRKTMTTTAETAQPEPVAPTTKTRTNWESALFDACRDYEDATGNAITAQQMVYPAIPGYIVKVGHNTPYPFPTAQKAALTVRCWAEAPR